MNREYHRWYSPSLDDEMELLIFGHAGARALAFPTSRARFYQWENRGMVAALAERIDNGWLQLFCVDSVDSESWYSLSEPPQQRAQRQVQYDSYLYYEVLPFVEHKNGHPFLITLGASFGAYHAMNFGLRHPDKVNRIVAMSGLFDIRRFSVGYHDNNVYFNNPIEYIPHEQEPRRLELLRQQDIIMATGRDDRLISSARHLSSALWDKGIGNALREWDGTAHDWPYWRQMAQLYIDGHD